MRLHSDNTSTDGQLLEDCIDERHEYLGRVGDRTYSPDEQPAFNHLRD